MDAKILMLLALLAPVLFIAAGVFAGRHRDAANVQPKPPSNV